MIFAGTEDRVHLAGASRHLNLRARYFKVVSEEVRGCSIMGLGSFRRLASEPDLSEQQELSGGPEGRKDQNCVNLEF
jgi:hypothetical protein